MIPYWQLRQFHAGPFVISVQLLLAAAGILVAHFLLLRRARRQGLNAETTAAMSLAMVLTGLAGAYWFRGVYYADAVKHDWHFLIGLQPGGLLRRNHLRTSGRIDLPGGAPSGPGQTPALPRRVGIRISERLDHRTDRMRVGPRSSGCAHYFASGSTFSGHWPIRPRITRSPIPGGDSNPSLRAPGPAEAPRRILVGYLPGPLRSVPAVAGHASYRSPKYGPFTVDQWAYGIVLLIGMAIMIPRLTAGWNRWNSH